VNIHQLENWARHIIEGLLSGRPTEDDRVEIKATWIDPADAARRLGAHANVARGEPILWLVGLDERNRTVSGADPIEMANWLAGIGRHFDGEAPILFRHANIHTHGQTVIALYFRTDAGAPFVVKNPKGGYPEFEVPWRKGTRLRAATRADLLTILVPIANAPEIRLMNAQLELSVTQNNSGFGRQEKDKFTWKIDSTIYVTPKSPEPLVFPHLSCEAWFNVSDYAGCPYNLPIIFKPVGQSATVTCATTEAIFQGPGSVRLEATGFVEGDFRAMAFQLPQGPAEILMILKPTNDIRPIHLRQRLSPIISDSWIGNILTRNQRKWVP